MYEFPDDPATRYAIRVETGAVVAGPYVRAACHRHLKDLVTGAERGLTWHLDRVDHVLNFFRQELTIEVEEEDEFGDIVSVAKPFEPHESQEFILGSLFGWYRNGIRRFRRCYIELGKGNGKACHLETPIPTPDGWRRFGDIRPGDYVFHQSGKPVQVIAESEVMYDRPCYELEFSDGAKVVADAGHLWRTFSASARQALSNAGIVGRYPKDWTEWRSKRGKGAELLTTQEIAGSLDVKPGYKNHSIPLASPLQYPEADLVVDPFVLGVWLGDGSSSSGSARISADFKNGDQRLIRLEFERRGYATTDIADPLQFGVLGLISDLKLAGVVERKHVPREYLLSSEGQRLDLLRGLMLTDGSVSAAGNVSFDNTNESLVDAVVEIARSLGQKAKKRQLARRTVAGKSVWRVTLTPNIDVFGYGRKAERLRLGNRPQALRARHRMIVGCKRVPSVPVKCIQVDREDGMFLIGEHLIPTHNSPLAAGIGHYMMIAMRKLRAEVYSAATDKDQAAILFRDAVEMYRRSNALSQHLVPSGHNPVWQLAYPRTSSYFKPISSEKKGKSGIRPFCALIDEVHEHPNNEVIEMLRAGTKGNQSALIFEITNSGNSRDSVCWDEHEYSVKVLQGEEENDGWFSLISALDEDDDPFIDESCWVKANPLLGVSIFPEFIREQVNEARGMPSKEALVRRLHFCQWTEGAEGWITRDVWMKTEAELTLADYEGERCFGGLDLSYTKDLTAFALAFPVGGSQEEPELDTFCWFWKPQEGLAEAIRDDRVPYDVWAKDGFLHLTAGRVIKLEPVAQFMADLSDRFDIRAIAYDNYRHRELEDHMLDLGIELPMIEHPQGFRRTENSRLWMPNSVQDLENGIIEARFRFKVNPLLRYNVAQAVVREDPAGTDNRIFDKKKSRARIDGIVACAMAVGAAVAREEPVFSVSLASLMED